MFNISNLISQYGYIIIFIFIFIETALLVGFFLPGDTLLLFAGYYVATGRLNMILVIITAIFAAVIGDTIAYEIGKKGGRRLFQKKDSLFFSSNHLERAEKFFHKHGPVTVLVARPIAFLRTFAPVVAGIGHMKYSKFLMYNMIGGILWVIVFTFLGYGIGEFLKGIVDIETINKFVDIITVFIPFLSIVSIISLIAYQKLFKGKIKFIENIKNKFI